MSSTTGIHATVTCGAASRRSAATSQASEGVSLAVPLPEDASLAAAFAGVWVALARTGAGQADAKPALALTAGPARLVAFLRPLVGSDLAALLWNIDASAIDDLTERWQTFPPEDPSVKEQVEALVRPGADAIVGLAARLRRGAP